MIPLLIVAALASAPYGIYRAARKWGVAFLYFLGAGVSFLGSTGVLAEKLWGPQWSWNFAHHGAGYGIQAAIEAAVCLFLGLRSRRERRAA